MTIRMLIAGAALAALAACGQPQQAATDAAPVEAAAPATPVAVEAAAGTYALDKNHASLLFRVNHFGLSNYTARFTDFDATITFDPANPTASSVTATVNPASVETDYPGDFRATHADSKFQSWDEELARNADWFAADTHKAITFTSTGLEMTGERTAKMTGDLTFRGVTAPVTLDVTFNGENKLPWLEGRSALGFSAVGKLDRSAFGMTNLGPAPIANEVEVIFEGEFWQNPPA